MVVPVILYEAPQATKDLFSAVSVKRSFNFARNDKRRMTGLAAGRHEHMPQNTEALCGYTEASSVPPTVGGMYITFGTAG